MNEQKKIHNTCRASREKKTTLVRRFALELLVWHVHFRRSAHIHTLFLFYLGLCHLLNAASAPYNALSPHTWLYSSVQPLSAARQRAARLLLAILAYNWNSTALVAPRGLRLSLSLCFSLDRSGSRFSYKIVSIAGRTDVRAKKNERFVCTVFQNHKTHKSSLFRSSVYPYRWLSFAWHVRLTIYITPQHNSIRR